jgi:S1-C subfamily serine protease
MAGQDFATLLSLSDALSGIAAAAAPSLVSVHSRHSLSSGFAWKPGLIVTADEALAETGEVAVTLPGGARVAAGIAGRDPSSDVALLRVEGGGGLTPVELDGAVPAPGALAVAVGSHDGHPLAALGVVAVSGPAWRSMRGGEIDARVELDLSLRRRAEGGLALDAAGRAFGMTVSGPRRRVLVIPGATVARVASRLETHGRIARGYLGLGLQPVRLDRGEGRGVMVMGVDADGPGARAGLRQGDVIVAWDGKPVSSPSALARALGPDSVGRTATLSVQRGGEERSVELAVGERPAD